eukprot:COSAG01_NODE_836_length_13206_cov_139.627375_9_plen_302_part_00
MPTIKGIVNRKVQSGVVHYKVRHTAKSVPDQWMPAPELDEQMIEVFEAKRAAKKRGQSQQGAGEGGGGGASAKRARLSEASAAEDAAAAAGQAGGGGSAKATTPGTATTSAAAAPADLGPAVSELLGGSELEEVTKKKVRRMLEERLGLETNSLDARKSEISLAVDRWVKQQEVVENEAAAGGDDDEEEEEEDGSSSDSSGSESESGDERAQAAAQAKATKPKVTVRTVSGKEAPKQLAKLQQSLMRTSRFLATAGDVEVRVLASASLCVPACPPASVCFELCTLCTPSPHRYRVVSRRWM